MKVAPALVIVSGLLGLLTLLMWNGLNLNSSRYDQELQALSDFTMYERGISREVLTSRAGLSRNFDALVKLANGYSNALARLRDAANSNSEEGLEIDVLSARVQRHEDLIEQFKSKNALLQNSFAYFGLFSYRLAASDNKPLVSATSALAAAMLHLTLDTSDLAAREVQDRLNELGRQKTTPDEAGAVRAMLAHGQMLHDLLPGIDVILKTLATETSNREQDSVQALIKQQQLAARSKARRNRLWQYVTSLLLLGGLVYFAILLCDRAEALRRRAAFEHAIANISTRFINSPSDEISHQVQIALEQLAGFIGADRAYFACSGAGTKAYRWSSDGVDFPEGWPERSLSLTSQLPWTKDGMIFISKIKPTEHNDAMKSLAEAGVRGWLCIPALCGERNAIFGFDAVRSGQLIYWAEFSLFRMASDAIANAVSRVRLEQDKERLQSSLQKARRMETVGIFASGIAHNFNNIVGAILGYAEMADARAEPGSKHALGEIRRAGDRARELVDQILTFGRQEEGRRERICVKALFAETTSLLTASLPPHVKLAMTATGETTTVLGKSAQLQQVFLNLCNNAAQAMNEPGVIELRIDAREVAFPLQIGRNEIGPGNFTVVSVTDPGLGMDEMTLERLFEPFFTTRINGNGLGLATVREIVEQHGGAIGVESELGAGTRFDVWLPSGGSNEPISARSLPDPMLRGSGETVLVLETDRGRLLRHEEILAALGYEPVGFTEFVEALAACREAPARFDVALVCHLRGSSSLDLAAALHSAAPALPIILAAPSANNLDALRLAASGITELVHHSLLSSELAGALSRSLASVAADDDTWPIAAAS